MLYVGRIVILSLLFSLPSLAEELLVYQPQDYGDSDFSTSLRITVRPGEKVPVVADVMIRDSKDPRGLTQKNIPAPQFTWQPSCNPRSSKCPTTSMVAGSQVVTLNVPMCMARGEVTFSVSYPGFSPVKVILASSEEPVGCPEDEDLNSDDDEEGSYSPEAVRRRYEKNSDSSSNPSKSSGGGFGGGGAFSSSSGSGGKNSHGWSGGSGWGGGSGGGHGGSVVDPYARAADVMECTYEKRGRTLKCENVDKIKMRVQAERAFRARVLAAQKLRAQQLTAQKARAKRVVKSKPKSERRVSSKYSFKRK